MQWGPCYKFCLHIVATCPPIVSSCSSPCLRPGAAHRDPRVSQGGGGLREDGGGGVSGGLPGSGTGGKQAGLIYLPT